jgi:hypothetical protein
MYDKYGFDAPKIGTGGHGGFDFPDFGDDMF